MLKDNGMIKQFITAAAITSMATGAFAGEYILGGGLQDGGYWNRMTNMKEKLSFELPEGSTIEVREHPGSLAIAKALCNGSIAVGAFQKDALYTVMKDGCDLKRGLVAKYNSIGEIAMMMVPPGSNIDDLDEIEAGMGIGIDAVYSGSELTMQTMQAIEKEHGQSDPWSDAKLVNTEMMDAEIDASVGDIVAVMYVRSPRSRDWTNLLDLGWRPIQFWDRDINDLEFGEGPLYEPEKFVLTDSGGKTYKEWGYKVESFVGVSPEIARDKRQRRIFQKAAQ